MRISIQQLQSYKVSSSLFQAFALQQRAFLQHALTYESLMQSSVAMTSSHYLQSPGRALASLPGIGPSIDADITTSIGTKAPHLDARDPHKDNSLPHNGTERSLKLEQVRFLT